MPRLKTRKGLWLLALLSLRANRDVDRNWLAGTLWPDADESTSLTYLRQTLTDLRKALGPASDSIKTTGFRSLRLDLESEDCDVSKFDELIAEGKPESYDRAIGLYSGPLLEGCTEEWVFQERQSRAQARLQVLELLAAHEIESGNTTSAIARLRQITAADPLRESAYRGLLRALASVGDLAAVMENYRELRLLLRRELNTEPDAETRALYESIRAEARNMVSDGKSPTTPAFSVPQPPANVETLSTEAGNVDAAKQTAAPIPRIRLPRYVSEFIGRGREIIAVRRSLSASRLVTLTGVGGVGKTRLAVRIAEEETSRFPVAAYFVDLAPISEPLLVASSAASALGLREHPSRSGAESIAGFVDSRATLLVLDNCEHVLSAVADITSHLLKTCPNLRILATSRQRLRISGETEWRVAPLEIPPESIPSDAAAAESLLRSNEALALFIDRAQRVGSGLSGDLDSLRAAAEICRRLDGIPLALELAAARLQALTVAQLADRLEQRFRLLVMGDVTAPSRQKTLRAMLDWSYDLLSDDERTLFRRLSVFAGGWTLEAVEAITGVESHESRVESKTVGIESLEALVDGQEQQGGDLLSTLDSRLSTLDILASLVDKSLVVFAESAGSGRYRMLETVKQYALEKLVRSGEENEIRRVHRDYFLQLAEEAAQFLTGPQQKEWLDKLEVEHDNLRIALDWCINTQGEINAGMRLAGALHRFWFYRGHLVEGRRRYAQLFKLDVEALPTPGRALALQGAGNMVYRQGDYLAARERFEQALVVSRQSGDFAREAELLANLGNTAYFQMDYDRALQLFQRVLDHKSATENTTAALLAWHGLGNIAFRTGDLTTARGYFETGLAQSREYGNVSMEGTARISLGLLENEGGEGLAAEEHLTHALGIFRQIGDPSQELICLTNLGMVNRNLGNWSQSAQYYREGLRLAEEREGNRDERVITYLLEGVAMLAAEANKPREAALLLAAGNRLRESISVPRPPQEQVEFDQDVVEVRAMNASHFDSLWSEGESWKVDHAISVALEIVGGAPLHE